MSLFDSILGQFSENADVANLADKVGISPGTAEKAIAALAASHQEPGDTIEGAATKTGLDTSVLSSIVEQIGGEGSLGEYARMLKDHPQAGSILKMLDRDGDGDVMDDISDFAGKLFGKK